MPEVVDSSILWTKALKKNYSNRQVVGGVDISITSGSVIGLLGRTEPAKQQPFIWWSAWPTGQWPGFSCEEEITALPMYSEHGAVSAIFRRKPLFS